MLVLVLTGVLIGPGVSSKTRKIKATKSVSQVNFSQIIKKFLPKLLSKLIAKVILLLFSNWYQVLTGTLNGPECFFRARRLKEISSPRLGGDLD